MSSTGQRWRWTWSRRGEAASSCPPLPRCHSLSQHHSIHCCLAACKGVCAHTRMHARTNARAHTHTHTKSHTSHTHAHIHTGTHTETRKPTGAVINTRCTHTHTHTHTAEVLLGTCEVASRCSSFFSQGSTLKSRNQVSTQASTKEMMSRQ